MPAHGLAERDGRMSLRSLLFVPGAEDLRAAIGASASRNPDGSYTAPLSQAQSSVFRDAADSMGPTS